MAKEEKVVKSAGKVMVTVFWDTERLSARRLPGLWHKHELGIPCLSSETAVRKKHREKTWRDAKRCASARMTMRELISAVQPSTKRWTVAPKCCRI